MKNLNTLRMFASFIITAAVMIFNSNSHAQSISMIQTIVNNTDSAYLMYAKDGRNLGSYNDELTGKSLGDNDWDRMFVIPPQSRIKAHWCGVPWANANNTYRVIVEAPWEKVKKFSAEGLQGKSQVKYTSLRVRKYVRKKYLGDRNNNGIRMWQSKVNGKDAIRFYNAGTGKVLGSVQLGKSAHRDLQLIIEKGSYELQITNMNENTALNFIDELVNTAGMVAEDSYNDMRKIRVEAAKMIISKYTGG